MIDQSAREVGVILGEGKVGERQHNRRAMRRRAHLARGAAYGRRKRAKSRHVVRNPARAFPVRLVAPSLRLGAIAAYQFSPLVSPAAVEWARSFCARSWPSAGR